MAEQEWNAGKLLELSGSYWQTCALHAGVKLDLFTKIGNQELSSAEIAPMISGDLRGVSALLNALAAMNLLSKSADQYTTTPAARTYLSKDSEQYVGHMLMHHHHLMDSWAQLHQTVLSGKPARPRASQNLDEFIESFLLGMFTMAMNIAPGIVDIIDISERRHLLDLGGGPGTYAIHFCRKNPELKATVFDLPTSQPIAEQTIQKFGLTDRIDFLGGDYLKDPVPGSYDVAWLSHILHGEGPECCQLIIEKAVSALQPGGLVVVHEFILNNTMDGPLFPALFSLNMLLGTADGQSYSEEQLESMLHRAGVREVHRLPFQGLNDSGLIGGIV